MFALRGRLGRIRYIAFTMLSSVAVIPVVGLAAMAGPEVADTVLLAVYAVLIPAQLVLTIRRCHDMDWSGWASVLYVIPLLNLVFWFVGGTPGQNRFGLRPEPHKVRHVVAALIFPLGFLLGIIAAVALPAYQEYADQVRQAEGGEIDVDRN